MNRLLLLLVLAVAVLVTVSPASAAFDNDAAMAVYDGAIDPLFAEESGLFSMLAGSFTAFFAVVAVACIAVTGFFLGRRWLRSVG